MIELIPELKEVLAEPDEDEEIIQFLLQALELYQAEQERKRKLN